MTLAPIYPYKIWNVSIYWSKPRKYEIVRDNETDLDARAHFYMIIGKSGRSLKLFYIGKTYRSNVARRLRNYDHQNRARRIRKTFPAYALQVSHGILDMEHWKMRCSNRYPSPKRIDQIETLLIYSNPVEESVNARKKDAHGITDHYILTNRGNYKPLRRKVFLTIFEKERPR